MKSKIKELIGDNRKKITVLTFFITLLVFFPFVIAQECTFTETEPNTPASVNVFESSSCTSVFVNAGWTDGSEDVDFFSLDGFEEFQAKKRIWIIGNNTSFGTRLHLFDGNNNVYAIVGGGSNIIMVSILPYSLFNPVIGASVTGTIGNPDFHTYGIDVHVDDEIFQVDYTQLVYIDYTQNNGVMLGNVGPFDIDPFNLTEMNATYCIWDNDLAMQQITNKIRGIYANYAGITFIDSNEADPPTENHSVLYIGNAESSCCLGVVDSIDYWNSNKVQEAIVFGLNFGRYCVNATGLDEMTNFFSSVGAHEVGHLLGLNHVVEDTNAVMDVDGVDDMFDIDSFQRKQLEQYIVPFEDGDLLYQDAPLLLTGVLISCDECNPANSEPMCFGQSATFGCGDFDGDGCYEWGFTSCGAGEICHDGSCYASCEEVNNCETLGLACSFHMVCSTLIFCGDCVGEECNPAGQCVPESECPDNCENAGLQCGLQEFCGGWYYCGECAGGECNVETGQCSSRTNAQTCTDTCLDRGWECGTVCSNQCGSGPNDGCSVGESCFNGICSVEFSCFDSDGTQNLIQTL